MARIEAASTLRRRASIGKADQVLGGWLDAWAKVKLKELQADGYQILCYSAVPLDRRHHTDLWRVEICNEEGVKGTRTYHDLEMAFYGAVADLTGTPYPLPGDETELSSPA